MNLAITPETKVGELLDAYPGIEETLIANVPAFVRLKNPILRKTVAKVTSLDQAARIAGVSVQDLVRKLREATGQPEPPPEPPSLQVFGQPSLSGPPAWLDESLVRYQIDADQMLETGVHPIGKVRQCVAASQPREIVKLTSGFRPVPLIESLRQSGAAVWSTEVEPGRHATYICAKPQV
jgi:hypothetical protein